MTEFSRRAVAVLLASLLTGLAMAMPLGEGMRPAGAKSIELAGKVSNDATSFLADDGNQWAISNAASVKGREGRHVVVDCRMDVAKRAIHVFGVRPQQAEGARMGDSAFRR